MEAALAARGALFFAELAEATGLLPAALEAALAQLIRAGRVTADQVAALRQLARPASKRAAAALHGAGRFARLGRPAPTDTAPGQGLFFARALLARYGVAFRALAVLDPLMPPWRELVRAFWRLEAQGEIRGGRFVTGVSGEQFARPEALAPLQRAARAEDERLAIVAGGDPANVTGIFLPSLALAPEARVLFADGRPLAVLERGRYRALDPEGERRRGEFERRLRDRGADAVASPRGRPRADVRSRLRAVSIAGR